jgi:hypothetical protein
MKVELDVTFETARPLPQDVGMQMWKLGDHFCAQGGKSTYRLKTSGTANTMVDAVSGVVAQISLVVSAAALDRGWPPEWSNVRVTALAARAL